MVSPIYQAFPRYVDAVEKDQRCVPTAPPRSIYSIHLVLHACMDTAEKVGGVLETLFL